MKPKLDLLFFKDDKPPRLIRTTGGGGIQSWFNIEILYDEEKLERRTLGSFSDRTIVNSVAHILGERLNVPVEYAAEDTRVG